MTSLFPRYDLAAAAAANPSNQLFPLLPRRPGSTQQQQQQQLLETSTNCEEVTTEFLVLDFSDVMGVDATAARSCFLTLVHLMKNAQVRVVFANLNAKLETLLRSHRVLDEESIVIPDIDDALEWCEDQIIAK